MPGSVASGTHRIYDLVSLLISKSFKVDIIAICAVLFTTLIKCSEDVCMFLCLLLRHDANECFINSTNVKINARFVYFV